MKSYEYRITMDDGRSYTFLGEADSEKSGRRLVESYVTWAEGRIAKRIVRIR